ncbi:hypothetical protein HO133_000220 [Letharia lupina]|uniref:Uncharacterized protein n=1 Tax=Letharia lupina TaxID=560253 RepID=A0A8H6CH10_9LECA|nr:uncharacterized protein HO133_000220 [Letharia lupina]KAF6223378.1 hypothetical protein HO133_000220 [Letharia lupina]
MAIASGMAQPELYSTLSTGAIQAYGNWLMIGRQQSFGVSSGHDHDHRLPGILVLGEFEPRPRKSSSVPAEGSFFLGQGMTFNNTSNATQEVKVERQRTLLVCYVNPIALVKLLDMAEEINSAYARTDSTK